MLTCFLVEVAQRCPLKKHCYVFRLLLRETLVLEPIFYYWKVTSEYVISCEFCEVFKKTYFEETYELILLFHCGSRRSHSEVFCKKAVFKNFVKFPEKLESHFDKVAGHHLSTLLENRPQHKCFSVNFARFLRTSILWNTCEWQGLSYCGSWFTANTRKSIDHEKHT